MYTRRMQPLIFFGSDRYSTAVLDRLITHHKYPISAVVTTRSLPAKSSSPSAPNAVEKYTISQKIKVLHYPSIQDEKDTFIEQLKYIKENENTIALTASFPRLLPPAVIEIFGNDIYNIHPSLLPQYRNVAPVPYAIAMGDRESGVSIFHISNGIDNGMIAAQTREEIKKSDTTPILLDRLFSRGVDLFIKYLEDPDDPALTSSIPRLSASELIFTRKLTRENAYIEWPVVQAMLSGGTFTPTDTENPLIRLRLTHHPDRSANILTDLIRAFTGYEKIWSTADSTKGTLQISLVMREDGQSAILIAGRPKPILWADFQKYYLG